MKKIFTLFAVFAAMTLCVKAQISDGFENYDPFTVDPAGIWTYYDGDGQGTYGFQGTTFENAYYTGSCIVFNPSLTDPSTETNHAAHSGSQYLAFFNATSGATNDWMISPQLSFTSNGTLTLYARELTTQYGAEIMKIHYSTTDNNPSSFTLIETENVNSTEWTEYSFTIPANAKYVAIQCNSNDVFALFIDDVAIIGATVNVADVETSTVNIYPNPANNVANVNANANINNIEIYSISGQKVADFTTNGTQATINTSNMSTGMYLMKINTENGVINQKFAVAR
ncbi:MAG: choice-of-anchor J domain-containing protein [Bacteroidales bacterium]|nr:choice-of-anchor J domain-containing protein [Bacteroidales bacterium]